MYKCDICKNTTRSREKQNKKVIKTRKKDYNYTNEYGNKEIRQRTEIVKEINVCEKCLKNEK